MTTTNTFVQPSPSAFLDTNALLNLFWFWEACGAANVRLDAVTDWPALKTALSGRNRFAAQISSEDAGGVKTGMTCFGNLYAKSATYQYYSSAVCHAEMHHVLLDSLGSERLVRRRIPRGLRVRRPQILYRRALNRSDYKKIEQDLDKFFDSLKLDYHIDIMEIELDSTGQPVMPNDIWRTAQAVWSRVLIDVIDSYIYAAAVEIDADVFLTSDGSLFQALNSLYHPTEEWASLVKSLNLALGRSRNALLPQPIRPGSELP